MSLAAIAYHKYWREIDVEFGAAAKIIPGAVCGNCNDPPVWENTHIASDRQAGARPPVHFSDRHPFNPAPDIWLVCHTMSRNPAMRRPIKNNRGASGYKRYSIQ